MSLKRITTGVLAVGLVLAIWAVPATAEDATAAKADNNKVPKSELMKMAQASRPAGRPRTQKEYIDMLVKQVPKVIKIGEDIEAKYPNATNLYQVQRQMLMAADFLVRVKDTDEAKAQRLEISKRIVKTEAPAKVKVTPDYFVTLDKIVSADGKVAKDAEKQIKAYIDRYAKTDAEDASLVRASQLAEKAKLEKLDDKLLTRLEKDYGDVPEITAYLISKGRGPVFEANLTLTDGSKLELPKDLLGKVVVIDFWATWCGPCRAYLPHMKKVYNEYKDKNVAFVGISLDKADQKQKLINFTKSNDMPWPQAYSGKAWNDPTARKYGVGAIPAIWVVGKNGKVFSSTARSDLAGTIDKALAQEAPEK